MSQSYKFHPEKGAQRGMSLYELSPSERVEINFDPRDIQEAYEAAANAISQRARGARSLINVHLVILADDVATSVPILHLMGEHLAILGFEHPNAEFWIYCCVQRSKNRHSGMPTSSWYLGEYMYAGDEFETVDAGSLAQLHNHLVNG
jgi:hypothetical protein